MDRSQPDLRDQDRKSGTQYNLGNDFDPEGNNSNNQGRAAGGGRRKRGVSSNNAGKTSVSSNQPNAGRRSNDLLGIANIFRYTLHYNVDGPCSKCIIWKCAYSPKAQ